MKMAGRPPFKEIPMGIWVLVELARDRIDGRPRDTVRSACKRLEKKLAKDIKSLHDPKWETFRHYYKEFEKTMRRSNNGEELTKATDLLVIARRRRDCFGWDASPWLFVMEPEFLMAKGVEVVIPRWEEFMILRSSIPTFPVKMNFSPTK